MQPLDKTLRNRLDRTVRKARPVAEQAAEADLEQLGVGEEAPPSYLSDDQRALRRRLRAHARSLGDPLKEGAQAVTRLIGEIAYEHWHRMLFARFLAENELLMYDGVAVTLEECEELAEEEAETGERTSGWALAARLASTMLPQVFRVDSPVFELTLAAEYQRELEALLAGLAVEVFHASDSLGWVYQFWQTDNKERINRSEVKIGADELPAVTQLFTEPYMVSFLLDNSLGAWWAARRLSETDLVSAESEQELRDKASLPGMPLAYLRFVKEEETGNWTPAAGTFDAWPESLAELKTLDPCCGSGHFLVAALLMLVPMRMELEGLSARDAVDAVLRDNLHGLEIDQRCVELAAFALALTAWRYPDTGGYRKLPELHLACSGLPINARKDEWLTLADNNTALRSTLEDLYNQFKNAPLLGSLISPEISLRKGTLFEIDWDEVGPLTTKALSGNNDNEKNELTVIAHGLSRAATILAGTYQWIITNVPYLTRGKQSEELMSFIEQHYYDARKDLAAVITERALRLIESGTFCAIVPQNLFQLTGYTDFRKNLLTKNTLRTFARLGTRAFETISGENVSVALVTIDTTEPKPNHKISAFDLSNEDDAKKKDNLISKIEPTQLSNSRQVSNPDSRVIVSDNDIQLSILNNYADGIHGLGTKDSPMFIRNFWEFGKKQKKWELLQASINSSDDWCGMESVIYWQQGAGELHERAKVGKAILAGGAAHNKSGVLISPVGDMRCGIYHGGLFDKSTAVISPTNQNLTASIYCYTQSDEFKSEIKLLDSKVAVTNQTLVKVPVNIDHWIKIAAEKYPHGLPQPYTNDPTQWIFHGHPCGSVIWDEEAKWTAHGPLRTDDTVLQVAVARLLGYRWPAELDPEMELAEEQREWVNRCEALLGHADRDGIVCLPAVRGERRAVDRLEALLADAYGDQWSATTRGKLLESVDHAGKDLESWLRDKFFAQHCKLFQNRPFIWHIWDGLKDGFSALVNYHKLDYKALETLTYTYLGDWITQQKKQINDGIDGAEARLAAAEALQKRLELILEGEGHPDQDHGYDIFVRWKPLEEQPIGWHPDLNDGVRLNIRPFLSVPDVKKKGAGVLVHKPNIHWKKDRGKDVESAPWYHLGPQLGGAKGDRINDYHLTLAAKKAAHEHSRSTP